MSDLVSDFTNDKSILMFLPNEPNYIGMVKFYAKISYQSRDKGRNMQTIHLQVEDDFIEELMGMLPSDKVTVVEENFRENRDLLQEALQHYRNGKADFIPYYESMTQLDSWLQERKR